MRMITGLVRTFVRSATGEVCTPHLFVSELSAPRDDNDRSYLVISIVKPLLIHGSTAWSRVTLLLGAFCLLDPRICSRCLPRGMSIWAQILLAE